MQNLWNDIFARILEGETISVQYGDCLSATQQSPYLVNFLYKGEEILGFITRESEDGIEMYNPHRKAIKTMPLKRLESIISELAYLSERRVLLSLCVSEPGIVRSLLENGYTRKKDLTYQRVFHYLD